MMCHVGTRWRVSLLSRAPSAQRGIPIWRFRSAKLTPSDGLVKRLKKAGELSGKCPLCMPWSPVRSISLLAVAIESVSAVLWSVRRRPSQYSRMTGEEDTPRTRQGGP